MNRTLYRHSESVPHFAAVGQPVGMHKVTLAVVDTPESLRCVAYLDGRKVWDCGPYRPGVMSSDRARHLDDCRAFFGAWVDGAQSRDDEESDSRRESFTPHGLANLPLLTSLSESIGPFCDD